MSDEIRLDLSEFEQWLTNKDQSEHVGTAASSSCPLARFAIEQTGYAFLCVSFSSIIWKETHLSKTRRMFLPEWAKNFIYALDTDGTKQRIRRNVTAMDTLTALRRISCVQDLLG